MTTSLWRRSVTCRLKDVFFWCIGYNIGVKDLSESGRWAAVRRVAKDPLDEQTGVSPRLPCCPDKRDRQSRKEYGQIDRRAEADEWRHSQFACGE